MSALADPRPANHAALALVRGLLVLAVLAAVVALALRGSSQAAAQPYGQFVVQAATGELVAGSLAGQTVKVDRVGLDRIDVFLGNYGRQNQGLLVLHITHGPYMGPDLAVATAKADQLRANGFVSFEFAPLSNPTGEQLAFWLEAPAGRAGSAVTAMGATYDAYPYGAAQFDNLPGARGVQDLAFKLYYQSGWLGSLAVVLARQAAGRPGIFGLPQLYGVVLAAYLLALSVLLVAAFNRLRL